MNATIGIDVGATTISGGLVTREGDVLHAIQRPTRRNGAGTTVESLLTLVGDLMRDARARDLALDGIGVGVAGVVNVDKGVMMPHPENQLPALAGLPLCDFIKNFSNLPAFVENDGNALALAEWMFGAGRGAHSLVLFAIGTDVGGGVIVADTLVRGVNGYAGEFHGLPVNIDGPVCYCGVRGCLGGYVAGRAIAARARQRIADGAASALSELAGGSPSSLTAESVFRAAEAGDSVGRAIVDEACEALGAAIAGIVNTLNPEVIVITGGVAQSLVPIADELRRRAAARAVGSAFAETRLHVVGGDKRQTVRGGAALVLYELARVKPLAAERKTAAGIPTAAKG